MISGSRHHPVPSRGTQSRPYRASPFGVAPGKRPRLTPNPAMLVSPDGAVMPFGTPGGDVQTQAMLQVLLNVLHFGMELQEAIEAPRVASYSFPSSFAPFEVFPRPPGRGGRAASPLPRATISRACGLTRSASGRLDLACRQRGSHPHQSATGLIAAGADPRRPAYAAAI